MTLDSSSEVRKEALGHNADGLHLVTPPPPTPTSRIFRPNPPKIARLYYGQMGAEGNMKGFVDALQGEEMLKTYADLRKVTDLPNVIRPILAWVLRNVLGDSRRASMLRYTKRNVWKFYSQALCALKSIMLPTRLMGHELSLQAS